MAVDQLYFRSTATRPVRSNLFGSFRVDLEERLRRDRELEMVVREGLNDGRGAGDAFDCRIPFA